MLSRVVFLPLYRWRYRSIVFQPIVGRIGAQSVSYSYNCRGFAVATQETEARYRPVSTVVARFRGGQSRDRIGGSEKEGGWIDPVYFNAIKYRCVQLKQKRVTRSRITRLECRYRFRERRKSKRIDAIWFVDVDV